MTRHRTTLACTLAAASLALAAAPVAGAHSTGTTPQTCDQSFSQPAPGTGEEWQPGGTDPNFQPGGTDPNFQPGPTYGPEWYSGVPCTNPGTPSRTPPPGPLEDVTGVLGGLFG